MVFMISFLTNISVASIINGTRELVSSHQGVITKGKDYIKDAINKTMNYEIGPYILMEKNVTVQDVLVTVAKELPFFSISPFFRISPFLRILKRLVTFYERLNKAKK